MAPPSHVVFFGTYDDDMHPRVRVLREGLAANGSSVTVCNERLGVDTAARVRLASRPWLLVGFAARVLRAWWRLWRAGAGLTPDVVIVGYLGHLDVHLARRRFPGSTIVVDHMVSIAGTLADRGVGGRLLRRAASAVDRAALRAADIVVVDTQAHAALAAPMCRRPPVVVPVGAPEAWFAAGTAGPARHRPPAAVFFGLYTPLQGTGTIAEALARLAPGTLRVTMIGDGQHRRAAEELLAEGHLDIEWVDWCPTVDLPKVVGAHDICLGIFGTTPKAMRVVPNKVFQGAAAGCAVVTSDTEVQREALGDAAVYVPPGDPAALAEALTALAADPAGLDAARRRASARAAAFRPAVVVADLVAAVSAPPAGSGRRRGPRPSPLALNAQLRWYEVARLLRRDRPARILELGCGRGGFGSRFAAVADYTGVEPDADSRARAGDAVGHEVHESLDTVGEGGFDWLCSFEVLEHIADHEGELRRWSERLRPGGRVVVSVPAHQRRYGAADAAVGHLRRYDPDDLRSLLVSAGLHDVEVWAYGAGAGDVLEWGRNVLAARTPAADDVEARTAGSGRWMVLPDWLARAGGLALAPFALLQRPFGRRGMGPGLIGTGVRR